MENQRGLPPIYDHHHHLQISFSAPHTQEMGFIQYFEDHNQVLSFLTTAPITQFSQVFQPLHGGATAANPTTTTTNNGSLGFNHNELVNNRVSDNNEQVAALDPKTTNDENCSDGSHSWWRSNSSSSLDKSLSNCKVKITRRKLREPRFCFQTRSDVDVLDDGYKWRKYGQKVVKNCLHPRSYYRCTHSNCGVKKRVERQSEDCRMVITTYEGRHSHSPCTDEDQPDCIFSF